MTEKIILNHDHYHERVARDPGAVIRDFTERQILVYNAAKYGEREVEEFTDLFLEENAASVESAIRVQVDMAGGSPVLVALGDLMRELIERAARASAESVVNTYNYDLARAIKEIGETEGVEGEDGEDYVEPPVTTYREKLFGATKLGLFLGAAWFAARSLWKRAMIAMSETARALNFGIKVFYENNPQISTQALITPFDAVCPICIDAVNGNPYPTIEAAFAAGPWPAHANCVHYVTPADNVTPVETQDLWTGEDWDYDPDPGDIPF